MSNKREINFENVKKSYIDFWHKATDFKSKADLFDFLAPTIVTYGLCIVLCYIPIVNLFVGLFGLVSLLPYVAVCVRRMNYVGKDKLLVLINLVPFVGSIAFIALAVASESKAIEGQDEANKEETFTLKEEANKNLDDQMRDFNEIDMKAAEKDIDDLLSGGSDNDMSKDELLEANKDVDRLLNG